MAQILDTVTAQLRADAGQFISGFNQSTMAVERFSAKVPSATRLAGTFRRGIGNLAFHAAGLPGPLGKMSEALLMFAGGSALTLGVVAGIGLIAVAFNKLSEAAENAEKIARDVAARFTEHLKTIAGFGEGQREGLVSRIAQLQAGIAGLQSNRFIGQIKLMEATAEEVRMTKELEALQASLAAIERERAKARHEEAQERHLQAIIEENERLIPLLELERDLMADMRKIQADMAARAVPGMPTSPFGGMMSGDERMFDRMARDAERQTARIFGDPEMLKDLQQLGVSAGRQFAMGLVDGIQSFEDVIKRVIFTIFDFFLTKGLTSIFAPGASILDASGGGLAAIQSYAPAMPLSLNVSLPAARTPFDIARDADWQRALRESITVARSQGFKP